MLPWPDSPSSYKPLFALAEADPPLAVKKGQQTFAQKMLQDKLAQAWADCALGWALLRAERLADAQFNLSRAEKTFTALKLPMFALHTRQALLLAEMQSGASVDLQTKWVKLATDYEALGATREAWRTRLYQVEHLNKINRSQEAQCLVGQAEAILQPQLTLEEQAFLLQLKASLAANLGDYEQATTQMNLALTIFAQLKRPLEVANCQRRRAWFFQSREQFSQALADLEVSQTLFKKFSLNLSESLCLRNRGQIASKQGVFAQALPLLLETRLRCIVLGRYDTVADCDNSLGGISYYIGLYDLATASYLRAQNTYHNLGLAYRELRCRYNLALVLFAQKKVAAALTLLTAIKKAVQATGDNLWAAELNLFLAEVLFELQLYGEASGYTMEAQKQFNALGNLAGAARALFMQSTVYLSQANIPAAQACLTTARGNLIDRPFHLWRIDHLLGQCAQLQGELETALSYYRAASATVKQLRQSLASEHASSGIFLQAKHLHLDSLNLAAEQNRPDLVLELAEKQRALALLRTQRVKFHVPRELQATLETCETQLRSLLYQEVPNQLLDAALTTYTDLLLRINHSQLPPAANLTEEALPDLASLRDQFKQAYPMGWMVLLYADCETEFLLVWLTADSLTLSRIPVDQTLQDLLEKACSPDYHEYLYRDFSFLLGETKVCWQLLRTLGAIMLPAEVQQSLHPAKRLIIIPGGRLHNLAWATLRVGEAWLCERAIIQLLPSLGLWSHLAALPIGGEAALLVGCSSFEHYDQELPFVQAELDVVAQHWPSAVTRLENATATRQAILDLAAKGAMSNYRLLHLASHAQLVAASGLLAHVKLWDGDLLLHEIAGLQLKGATVVLAACESAKTEVLPGDELLSLDCGFLAAGARDVIASLWPVFDAEMQKVFTLLYDLIQHEDVPTALAQTQRALLAHSPQESLGAASPLVWGALRVVGVGTKAAAKAQAGRPLELEKKYRGPLCN